MRRGRGRREKKAAVLSALLLAGVAAAMLVNANGYREEREMPAAGGPLGIAFIDIADEKVAASYHVEECGVYVLAVDEDSQAYDAGVRSGDRLISLNGTRIHTTSELEAAQRSFAPFTMVQMDFRPHSQEQILQTTLMWNGDSALP